MATYEQIIKGLGEALGSPLKPDQNSTCLLEFEEDGMQVYLEPDAETDDLILGISLGEVAPGKGRESFFRTALIANGKHRPFLGRFAYSRSANQLVLFERAPMRYLDGKMAANLMLPLTEEARKWQEAVKSGRLPEG